MLTHTGNELTFSTGKLQLSFNLGDKITLADIKGKNAGLLGESGLQDYFWRMALKGPDSSSADFNSGDVAGKVVSSESDDNGASCRFSWLLGLSDGSEAEVSVDIRCRKGDALSYWNISAKIPKGWKVEKVEFPVVPNLKGRGGLKLAAPAGWGLEYQNPGEAEYGGSYPSCMAVMQFFALYRPTGGLYVGAHDSTASHKYFSVTKGSENGLINCKVTNWTAIVETSEFELPYSAVVGVIENGYMEAASIYREWVEKSAPWKTANVKERKIPQWVKESDLWFRVYEAAPETLESLKKARKFFDVNTTLHWYRWHRIPYDTLYPEYLPPKEAWPDAVKTAQELGFHVMPYINGRLWDPASNSWRDEKAGESAALKEDGGFCTEVYGSKVPLNVMCPSTDLWQNKVVGLVDALIRNYGVNGVYIDQIGAAYPERCFNENHPHPIGGGDFWVSSYRQMLKKVRAKLLEEKMITTEENAEPWNDLFDALLIVNTHTRTDAPPIPLYPAVYSGNVIPFAFQYSLKDDLDKSWPFRMKMARCFLWGSQVGWYDVNLVMDDKYVQEAEFLRELARTRSKARKFLLYGKFLREVKVEGDNPIVDCEAAGSFGGTYQIHLPSVMAAKWQAPDGENGIAVCNTSNEERKVKVEGREMTLAPRSAAVVSPII